MQMRADLSGRQYAVYGLARTGLSVLGFLGRSGARVLAWDEVEQARAKAAEIPGINITDLSQISWAGVDGLILSPGVPLNRHPLVAQARAHDVPVLGDMELFQWVRAQLPPHRLVAITGTNGKSTLTALLHHILDDAGVPALLGGNIGRPILDAEPLPEGGVYVLELSSFQIDLCDTLAADIAIYLNLTPDHLDRYDAGMTGYAASKQRLFAMQRPGALAIIATDDDYTCAAAESLPAGIRLQAVSASDINPDDQLNWPALPGLHNAQNVACAMAAARALGLSDADIEAGLRSYAGLAHRMEIIGTLDGVIYVNDSKATNVTSAARALTSSDSVHWILGGHAKTEDLDECLPHLSRVRQAYVIGEAADLFAGILAPHVPVVRAGTLAAAVQAAARNAHAGDVVLLSPACASYDQFSSFEERGDAFRAEFQALSEGGRG